jgi:tetratricopeptide (TPR) repeat protein
VGPGEPDREALVQAHDERAAELFEAGDWAGALVELQAAQRLLPATPRVYNMAVCHERLGHRDEAIALYRRFVDLQDAQADRVLRAEERLGELEEQSAVPELGGPGPGEAHATDAAPVAPPSRRRLRPAAFYALLGATLAIGATATVTGSVALAWHDERESIAQGEPGRDEHLEDGPRLAHATDALIGVGAALAVATLVVGLFTRFRDLEPRPGAGRLRPALGATGAGWAF